MIIQGKYISLIRIFHRIAEIGEIKLKLPQMIAAGKRRGAINYEVIVSPIL